MHPTIDVDEQTGLESKQIWLHCVVRAIGGSAVQECKGRITALRKLNKETEDFEEINLGHQLTCQWALTGDLSKTVEAGAEEKIDVAFFDEVTNRARIMARPLPNSARDVIAEPGTYRIRVLVYGAGQPHESEIEFTWGPNWNNVEANVIEASKP